MSVVSVAFSPCLCCNGNAVTVTVTRWQDRDNNGYVDVDELTNLHSTTKERLTMLEAKTILQVGRSLSSRSTLWGLGGKKH